MQGNTHRSNMCYIVFQDKNTCAFTVLQSEAIRSDLDNNVHIVMQIVMQWMIFTNCLCNEKHANKMNGMRRRGMMRK